MGIREGYILQPRSIDESEVSNFPPHVREIWLYLLRKANHADAISSGKTIKRGQLFTSYSEILEALSWKVGYRKERYKRHHCETAMKLLMKATMITTTKTTRGFIITICKYDYYQNPKNYETDSETDSESDNETATRYDTINKNEKNDNNILSIKGEEKIISDSLFRTLNYLLADQSYIEMLCMNKSVRNIDDMKDYLKTFFVDLESRGEKYKDEADAKHHFSSWLTLHLEKQPQKEKGGNSGTTARIAHNGANDKSTKETYPNYSERFI